MQDCPPFKVVSHFLSPSFTSPKTYPYVNGKVLVANDIPFHFGADFCNLQTWFYKDFGVTGPVCLDSARSWSRATYAMGPGGIWMGWMLWMRFFSTFQIFILPRFPCLMMKLWFWKSTHFSMAFWGQPKSLSSMVWASCLCFTAW